MIRSRALLDISNRRDESSDPGCYERGMMLQSAAIGQM